MRIAPVSRVSPFTRHLRAQLDLRPAVRTLHLLAPHGLQVACALPARTSPGESSRRLNTVAEAKVLSKIHCDRLAGFGAPR